MARHISSDETKDFIDWLEDEHDCVFYLGGSEVSVESIKQLWDEFVDG